MERIEHWIDGRRTPGTSDRYGEVTNPATGEVTAHVAFASPEDVDTAVRAAGAAFPAWRDTPIAKRIAMMFTIRDLLNTYRDDLARIVSAEHGKVHLDALGELQRGIEVVEYACGLGQLLKGEMSEQVSTGVDVYSLPQPLGVAAGITPFNFPLMVPMWMWPMAIACGNTFVLKPSEKDPSASLRVAELLAEAGVPPGVFNVVHGDAVAVNAVLDHPGIAAVSFVGSTPIARHVYTRGTAAGKRVQALGGAKNHALVLPDADMDMAADALVSAAYGSTGQRCMAISTAVAVGDAGDLLRPLLEDRIGKLVVGPATDAAAVVGPLVTSASRDRVRRLVDSGVAQGADLAIDGRDVSVPDHEDGFWFGPTLFDHVTPDMDIYKEEIFGPVLIMLRAAEYEDAVDILSGNPYGNGTAIFTRDGGLARRFQHEVEVGMVGINVPIPVPFSWFSFGGWKHSLFGDTHIYGPEAVHFYTRRKVVTSRWPDRPRGVDLAFPTSG